MNARCVWTFLAERGSPVSSIVLFIDRQDFELTKDGLIFYTWDEHGGINATTILSAHTGTTLTFYAQHAFLYFSSDNVNANTGFRLLVLSTPGGQDHNNDALFLQTPTCADNLDYPRFPETTYDVNARVSLVIQTTSTTAISLAIDYLNTTENVDLLDVYLLPPFTTAAKYQMVGSYSGEHPEGIDTGSSEFPRLVLFSSNEDETARGFSLRWF